MTWQKGENLFFLLIKAGRGAGLPFVHQKKEGKGAERGGEPHVLFPAA